VVRGTFSPARARRPAVVARLARTLGLTKTTCGVPPPSTAEALRGTHFLAHFYGQTRIGAYGNIRVLAPSSCHRHQGGYAV